MIGSLFLNYKIRVIMLDNINPKEDYLKSIDSNNYLDFSFLNNVKPYCNDTKLNIDEVDIKNEISKLSNEINHIDIRSIPFDKWDYIVAFTIGILEVAGDFFISDHNNKYSVAYKISDKNNKLGSYFNSIHKKIDHSGQPLDYQGYKFGGGNHRGRTFGHDLIMFPLAIYMLCSGKFIDGYYKNNIYTPIMTTLNQNGNSYSKLSFDKSLIEYLLHMIADFFSAKSLPIPGFSLLSHFDQHDIRKFANNLYEDGLNLRNLAIQGVPVATTEFLIWIYNSLRYKNSDYDRETIENKKYKLLLIAHGIATAVNIGKVIFTKNPTSLNLVMIIRVIRLCWEIIEHNNDLSQRAIKKINLSVLKNKFETMDTLILLDKSLYYTSQINNLIDEMRKSFNEINEKRNVNLKYEFDKLNVMIKEFKNINN